MYSPPPPPLIYPAALSSLGESHRCGRNARFKGELYHPGPLLCPTWLRHLRYPGWSHPKGFQVAKPSCPSCAWWLTSNTWPEAGSSPGCSIGLPFSPLHTSATHLLNRQAMAHRKEVVGPEPGGPRETLPRFLFLVRFPAWPFKACNSLKSKTER